MHTCDFYLTWLTDWPACGAEHAPCSTHTPVATKMWSKGFCFLVNRHDSISIHCLTAEHTVWVLEASQMHQFPHKSCICIFKQRCGFCLDVFTFSSWYGASNLVLCLSSSFSCICMACLLYTFAILHWEVGRNMRGPGWRNIAYALVSMWTEVDLSHSCMLIAWQPQAINIQKWARMLTIVSRLIFKF